MSFFKSWKTSLAGVGLILAGAGALAGAQDGQGDTSQALGQIMAGIGLLFAKDSGVTGK